MWLLPAIRPVSQCPVAHDSPVAPVAGLASASKTPSLEDTTIIMARLPQDDGNEEQLPNFQVDYYRSSPDLTAPGTLEYEERHKNVRYTQARLPVIDSASRDIWTALHGFRAMSDSYAGKFQCRSRGSGHRKSDSTSHTLAQGATCPMKKGAEASTALDLVRKVFNWDDLVLPLSTEGVFYGVVFRSKRASGSADETPHLMSADKLSHEEAVNSGGLLMYWYGMPDPATGANLATCVWRSRGEARAASALPLHKLAVRHAAKAYEDFELSRYKVVKLAGETGVRIEEWDAV